MGSHLLSDLADLDDLQDENAGAEESLHYRNMFSRGSSEPTGHSRLTAPKTRRQRWDMLNWLADPKLEGKYEWPDGSADNLRIPAGYTYLAQFVIHDTLQGQARFPALDGGAVWRRDGRSTRLMLETLYGDSAASNPLPYAAGKTALDGRETFRLSAVRPGKREGQRDHKSVGTPRDLARLKCPFLHDENAGWTGLEENVSEVLIPDPRNDDNIILSQLTVMFQLLHNAVYRQLEEQSDNASERERRRRRPQNFHTARMIDTLIYRRIVFGDLLPRLLHPAVLQAYDKSPEFYDKGRDHRVPLEFSHAAGRVGHVMVRGDYVLNDRLPRQPLGRVVRHNSLHAADEMPLRHDWLVDWSRFFETSESGKINPSRKIGPDFFTSMVSGTVAPVEVLVDGRLKQRGLAFRDLIRGEEANLCSVHALIEGAPKFAKLSPLVSNGKLDCEKIRKWLEADAWRTPGRGPRREYIDDLSKDPPLLLFILIEAAETKIEGEGDWPASGQGERLGAIGSMIWAEFLYGERERTRSLIEDDTKLLETAEELFKSGSGIPGNMPDLIRELARRQEWAGPEYAFL